MPFARRTETGYRSAAVSFFDKLRSVETCTTVILQVEREAPLMLALKFARHSRIKKLTVETNARGRIASPSTPALRTAGP